MKVHHLQLGEHSSPFDETVLTINGREEETVSIEAEGSRAIAEEIAWLVNHRSEIIDALVGAANALRLVEKGKPQPVTGPLIAELCEQLVLQSGEAA